MKRLTPISLLAAVCLVASTAVAATPTASKDAKAPVSVNKAPRVALVGTWEAVDATGGALRGRIVLSENGKATLAPEGQTALSGTWAVDASGSLALTMPPYGVSTMRYTLNKEGTLSLLYENGSKQTFRKTAAAPSNSASSSSKSVPQ